MSDVAGDPVAVATRASAIAPYLPRVVVEWMHETPDAIHRRVEATLVFVDISGFTKLSERLAREGKVGAEKLATTIDGCFEQLLEVAYGYGANLLKFGGDALLLLFSGDRHGERSCPAAIAMRRKLREVGRLRVGDKAVSLRMSVGLHSGLFHLFLVGDVHRELLLTGPGVSATVAMEGAAGAGDILVSEQAAAALPASCLGAVKGDGRLLRSAPAGAPEVDPEVVAVPAGLDLTPCIPTALRPSVFAGVHEAEHRLVTVAFIGYVGVDESLAAHGAAKTAQRLDALVRHVQHASDRWSVTFLGSDIARDGGKLILAGGAPSSSGDDERRMLLALREIIEADLDFPLQIGVNRGSVFVGDIGPPYRRTFTVMGDAVNLAARLMAKAEPGQILAGRGVLDASRTDFDTVALEPFLVKGKAEPVLAASVGPPRAARAAATFSVPLIGRVEELDVLLEGARRAVGGTGSIIELVGSPGMGKSRLVGELRSRTTHLSQFELTCESYESATAYFAWYDLMAGLFGFQTTMTDDQRRARLRDVIDAHAPELRPWVPLVAAVVAVSMDDTEETAALDGRFRRQRLGEVTAQLFGALVPTPTLFTIEDAQWMDEASADLLEHIAADLPERPWLFCLTAREGEVSVVPAGTRSLHLRPLEEQDAVELLHATSEGMTVPVHQIAALVERSGGNPLFLRELVASAGATGEVEDLPDSVQGLLMARLDRLAPEQRRVVRHASVLGRSFSLDLLAEVVDDVEIHDGALWDQLTGLIHRAHDTVEFDHALIRDAAYEGLPYRLRRRLHARAGDVIQARSNDDGKSEAELLSLHFLHARRHAEAWRFARLAAQRATALHSYVEAAEFLGRALESARGVTDLESHVVAGVHEELGDAHNTVGYYAGAEVAYQAARRLVKDDLVADARLMLKLAWLRGWTHNYPLALRWISLGLRRLDGAPGAAAARLRCQMRTWYGRFCQEEGLHTRAIKWCRIALDDATAVGDKESQAHALRVLGWADQDLGRLDSTTHLDRALALYEELGDLAGQAGVLNMLGGQAYFTGRWGTALELYERARDTLGRAGNTATQAFETSNIGEILLDQGHIAEAERAFIEALRIWTGAGHRSGMAYAKLNLARARARQGRYADAWVLFEESRAESVEIGAHGDVLEVTARMAECRAAMGDSRAALALAEDAFGQARSLGTGAQDALLYRVRGVALGQLGDHADAKVALDRSVSTGRSRGDDFEVALSLRSATSLADRIGDPTDDDRWSESRRIFDRLGVISAPELLARTA